MRWSLLCVLSVLACGSGAEDVEPIDSDTLDVVPEPAPAGLVETEEIPAGDPDCEWGGVRIHTGLDDGSQDGVAGDGVLQRGEVRSSSVVCSGLGSTAPPAIVPSGPTGSARLNLSGGPGQAGVGGTGGSLVMSSPVAGAQHGEIALLQTGSLDIDVVVPPTSVAFGPAPLVVASETTVQAVASGGLPSVPRGAAVWYEGALVLWDGMRAVPVTGIDVGAGATLRLPSEAQLLDLSHDVRVEGTVTMPAPGVLDITCRNIVIEAAGRVELVGSESSPAGGILRLSAVSWWGPELVGVAVVAGTIDLSGAPSAQGGKGGYLRIAAIRDIWMTGSFVGKGGESTGVDVRGGGGGDVFLTVRSGAVHMDGEVDLSGGVGARGGHGGVLSIDGFSPRLAGMVNLSGADARATGCQTACAGGNGGDLLLVG